MDLNHLIRMANRIGQFFEAMPDRAEALAGIANHLTKFWTPVMLKQFGAAIEAGQAPGLLPIVADAWRAQGQPGKAAPNQQLDDSPTG